MQNSVQTHEAEAQELKFASARQRKNHQHAKFSGAGLNK
jgi:hypothetical protein